jgi:hypothetical protein
LCWRLWAGWPTATVRGDHDGRDEAVDTRRWRETEPGTPPSFFIPSRERRDRLVVGEDVKLAFETPDGRSERMWVTITKAEPPRFLGVLASVPAIIDLAVGARVAFEARHVTAIHEDPQALGYRPDEQAAASRRVIERDQAPGVVVWEPDAGCFYVFAGQETEAEVRDSAAFMPQTLGLLTDRFPALEEVFGAPRRPGFWLLGSDGRYRPSDPPV